MASILNKLGLTHTSEGAAKENSNRVSGPAAGTVGQTAANAGMNNAGLHNTTGTHGHTATTGSAASMHGSNPNAAGPNPSTISAPGANESWRGIDNSAQVRTGADAERVSAQAPLGYAGQPLNVGGNTGAAALPAATGVAAGSAMHHHHHHATHSHHAHATTGVASDAALANRSAVATGGVAATGIASDDNAMTRSEERLLVSKQTVAAGEAALHKYVTTEHVRETVPVVRERAVLEREPITDANRDAALSGPAFREAHHEVTLHEERAVAEKQAVAVERVRLHKEQEVTAQYVGADLRKEHIEYIDGTNKAAGLTTGTSSTATSTHASSGLASDKALGAAPVATDASRRIGSHSERL